MYVNVICTFSLRCLEMYLFAKCMKMYLRCTLRCTSDVHLDFPEWRFFFPDDDVLKCTKMYKNVHLRCTFPKCTPNVHPDVPQMYSSQPLIALSSHYIMHRVKFMLRIFNPFRCYFLPGTCTHYPKLGMSLEAWQDVFTDKGLDD